MDGHIWLVANNPTIMARWYVEDVAAFHFDHASIVHGCSGSSGNNHSDVLHIAALLAQPLTHVYGPLPAGFVRSAANGQTTLTGAALDNLHGIEIPVTAFVMTDTELLNLTNAPQTQIAVLIDTDASGNITQWGIHGNLYVKPV